MLFRRSASEIREELASHLADATDDLITDGVQPEAARRQAAEHFGDLAAVTKSVAAIESPTLLPMSLWATAGAAYAILLVVLVSLRYMANPRLTLAQFERVGLGELQLGTIILTMLGCHWIGEYFGWRRMRALWFGLGLSVLVAMTITTVLDVDDFEVNTHALILGVLVAGLAWWRWQSLTVRMKKILVYSYALISTWTALTSRAIFSWFGAPRCLYLTPDAVPYSPAVASCHQASWFSPTLLPLYPLAIISLVGFVWFLSRYLRNQGTALVRKIGLAGMMVAIPVTPVFIHDINNYGAVDVIPWKAEIVRAYQDILGRDPEPKDMDFYALTRSYQSMHRVRQVLYDSYERRLKINLVHQEVLGRSATEEEMSHWTNSSITIRDLRRQLQSTP